MKKQRGTGAEGAPVEVKRATMSLRNLPPAPVPVQSAASTPGTPEFARHESDRAVRAGMRQESDPYAAARAVADAVMHGDRNYLYFLLLDALGMPVEDGRLVARVPDTVLHIDMDFTRMSRINSGSVVANSVDITFPEASRESVVEFCAIFDSDGREMFRANVGGIALVPGARAKFPAGSLRITIGQ